jgi:hypothetical protein
MSFSEKKGLRSIFQTKAKNWFGFRNQQRRIAKKGKWITIVWKKNYFLLFQSEQLRFFTLHIKFLIFFFSKAFFRSCSESSVCLIWISSASQEWHLIPSRYTVQSDNIFSSETLFNFHCKFIKGFSKEFCHFLLDFDNPKLRQKWICIKEEYSKSTECFFSFGMKCAFRCTKTIRRQNRTKNPKLYFHLPCSVPQRRATSIWLLSLYENCSVV